MSYVADSGTPKYALLIGVGRYDRADILPPLKGPLTDVRNLAAVLSDSSVGGFDVKTLEDVDSQTACTAIESFLDARSEDDTVVLYYSGHGFIDPKGALFLCATNSTFDRPKTSTIRADFLTDLIDGCKSKRLVLLLDCCYSGNFAGNPKAASAIAPQFQGTGLGRIVLTAGAPDQVAWDAGGAGSVFTRHIVEGLRSGEADRDKRGVVTVQELYDYAYWKVVAEQPRQRPGKWTYREDGPSFVIARNPKGRTVELPQWLLHELGSEVARTREAAVQRLAEMLAGDDVELRRLAFAKLESVSQEDDSGKVRRLAQTALESRPGVDPPSPQRTQTTFKPVAPFASSGSPPSISTPERPHLAVEPWRWIQWLLIAPAASTLAMYMCGYRQFLAPTAIVLAVTSAATLIATHYRRIEFGWAAFSDKRVSVVLSSLAVILLAWTDTDVGVFTCPLFLVALVALWRLLAAAGWGLAIGASVPTFLFTVVCAFEGIGSYTSASEVAPIGVPAIYAATLVACLPLALVARRKWGRV